MYTERMSSLAPFEGAVVFPDFTSSGTAEVSAPFTFSGQLTPEGSPTSEALGRGHAAAHADAGRIRVAQRARRTSSRATDPRRRT